MFTKFCLIFINYLNVFYKTSVIYKKINNPQYFSVHFNALMTNIEKHIIVYIFRNL